MEADIQVHATRKFTVKADELWPVVEPCAERLDRLLVSQTRHPQGVRNHTTEADEEPNSGPVKGLHAKKKFNSCPHEFLAEVGYG